MTEWTTVGSGGRSRGCGANAGGATGAQPSLPSPPPTAGQVLRCQSSIAAASSEIRSTAFYEGLRMQLAGAAVLDAAPPGASPPPEVVQQLVVYGLGSLEQPGAVHIRYQAALVQLLVELLPRLAAPPEAYDPVFTALDRAVLPALGIFVLERNEQGRRLATQPTLFFMPHCETELIDALLAANAAAGTLHNVVILGNSMRQYCERWALPTAARCGRQRPQTLLRLCSVGAVVEAAVSECGFPVASAFNDLGIHTFAANWRTRWLSC